jgi:hypothetical protein
MAVQRLHQKHKLSRVDVVILKQATALDERVIRPTGQPGIKQRDAFPDNFVEDVRALATELGVDVTISALPASGLTLSLNPEAENTVILYRGRRLVEKFENIDLSEGLNDVAPKHAHPLSLKGFTSALSVPDASDATSAFQKLDQAVTRLVNPSP